MSKIYNDITETIGNTPLVRLNRTAKKHGAVADADVSADSLADLVTATA